MTITTKTITGRRGLGTVESAVTKCAASVSTHFLAAAQGGVNTLLNQGCGYGQTITSPAILPTGGLDVVIEADASDQGTLTIEDSADGVTWAQVALYTLWAGNTLGYRFTPGAAQYRVKFSCDASRSAKKVQVFSQSRT